MNGASRHRDDGRRARDRSRSPSPAYKRPRGPPPPPPPRAQHEHARDRDRDHDRDWDRPRDRDERPRWRSPPRGGSWRGNGGGDALDNRYRPGPERRGDDPYDARGGGGGGRPVSPPARRERESAPPPPPRPEPKAGPRIITTDAIANPVRPRADRHDGAAAEAAERTALERAEARLRARAEATGDALADEDEEAEAERLLAESRKRRAEIMARHRAEGAAAAHAQPQPAQGERLPAAGQRPPAASPAAPPPPAAIDIDGDGGDGDGVAACDQAAADGRGAAKPAAATDDDDDADKPAAAPRAQPAAQLSQAEQQRAHELRAFLLDQRRRKEEALADGGEGADGGADDADGGADAADDGARKRATSAAAAAVAAAASASAAPKSGVAPKKKGGGGFDMFSDSPILMPTGGALALQAAAAEDVAPAAGRGDANDDIEGYFAHRVGDVLDGRFKIVSAYGRGVFSSVVKCIELDPAATAAAAAAAGGGDGASAADGGADGADGDEPICLSSVAAPGRVWAVKILRNNEMMRRAGEKEASILARLRAADPDDKQHVISFRGSFEHEGHLCLAFEAMHQNLRQAVRQHGHRRGIQIDAVRTYARHLLTALRLLARVDVIHADLKPDNIVVNDKYSTLKLCDLGSAMGTDEAEITPLLQSRFYRAPEVMLGLPYGTQVDLWSAACTLFELYTGKFLFNGNSNNAMLRLQQEVKGKVPARLLRKGAFVAEHFSADGDFLSQDKDKVTGREIVREIKFTENPTRGRDIRSQILAASAQGSGNKLSEAEQKKALLLADLLDKLLVFDPARRLTAAAALKHAFITSVDLA